MTAALTTLALLVCSQAPDTFSLRFDGFTSTQEMRADQLTKLMHAAFESVSDEPGSRFVVVDVGNADVVVTAMQKIEGQLLLFQYFLTTTKCPVRTTDFLLKLPRKAVDTAAAQGMAREVAKRAEKLLHEQVGDEALACAEDGQSLGGTVADSEPAEGLEPLPSSPGAGGVFIPMAMQPRPARHSPAPSRCGGTAPGPTASATPPKAPGSTGVNGIVGTSPAPVSHGSGVAAFPTGGGHSAFGTPVQSTPAPGSSSGGTTTTTTTSHHTGAVVHVAPAHR